MGHPGDSKCNGRRRRLAAWLAAFALIGGVAETAHAQIVRNFTSRYSRTDRGNYVFIGNTLMTCPDAASGCANARIQSGSTTNNQDFTMVPVDVDTVETGANSSTATLTLPAGSTVRFAALYWGATSSSAARNIAKLRTPAGATYNTVTASQVDVSGTAYNAFTDVTALVTAGGSGSYTVADVKATTGSNTYAGWGLVVVYSDSTETPHNVTLFDGFASVQSGGGSADATVSGFVTPPSGTVATKVGFLAYEGDFSNPGDSFRVNGTALTNALNAANNMFNSTISNAGVHVTTKSPHYLNQLGFDLDSVDATGLILNSATSAALSFTPGSDNYLPGVLVFSTDVYQPLLAPNFTKTVTDVNGGLVSPGDVLEYVVSVSNTGNDAADSVVLTDAIPANTTYVAGSLSVLTGANAGTKTDATGDDQANYDSVNNRVVFRLGTGATSAAGGSLIAGASTSIRFRVTIGAATANGTSIANSAAITYVERQLGGSMSIASNTATTTVSVPDLTIAKSHTGSFVRGSTGTYSLVVSNTGVGASLGTVTVSDTLPSGLTPTTASGTGWSCGIASQTVTCTRSDSLAASASYPAISIAVSVSQSAAASLTNTATVSGGSETATGNNSASDVTAIVSNADLSITKTGPASAMASGTVVYTVTVTNNGPSTATGVSVADPTPANLTFVSNTGACTTAYPCSIGTLASGASAVITTTYSLPNNYATPSTITNTATVSSTTTDPTSSNDSATATTPVTPSTDLSISKSGPSTIVAGNNIVYTVTVSNIGGLSATGVTVADPTPSGLTFVSNTGACATAYPCSVGTIAAGATATITTTYAVPSFYTTPNPIVNTATVSSTTTDHASGNNSSSQSTTVSQSADVAITKTGPASVTTGTNLVYTVTITNNGASDAAAVTVTDPTPSGLTFVSNTGNCTTAYPCSLGAVPAGATRTITSTYSVPASYSTPNPIVNTATVSTSTTDPTSSNNTSTSSTPVVTRADLAITKTGPASALAGNNVVYTVVMTNNGTSDAAAVMVTDPTPTNLTFVSNTGACTTAYPCSLGTVPAGATRTITTTYSLPSNYSTPTTITNTASVSSTTTDPSSANNSATATTPVTPSTDLSVSKTGPASVTAGNNVVYTVAVSNIGAVNASSVSVADPTPTGLTFVSNTGACTTAYPCSLGTLNAGATATITTTYAVPSSYTAPSPIVNTATVSTSTVDQQAANDSSTASTPVNTRADLSITKTGPASVMAGTSLVYTVVVTNNGASDALGVSVADTTPTGLTFVSNTGNCTSAYPCSLGTVPAGSTRTITTTYAVPASYTSPDPIVNTATVSSSTTDPVAANDSDTESTPLVTSADLSVTKTGPASALAGSNLVYTVVVTNNGVSDAAAVSVADPTPTGLTFVSNTGACTTAYPCSLGVVPAGATRTITSTYSIPLAYGSPDPIVNTATVSSSTSDPNAANDSDTESTPLQPSTDLSITKTGPVSATAGENLVYTIVVSNNGGSAAASTVVTDPAPSGLVFVSNTGDCTTAFPCSLGSVGAGATRTITSTWLVPSSYTSPDPILNTASVSSAAFDTVPGNDSDTESTPLVRSADLEVTKTGPASVTAGQNLVYTVVVTNNGSSDALSVSLADPTPTGLTFVSNAGDCTTGYPCALGTIAAGDSRTITTTYAVPAAYTSPDPIVNTATVSSATADPVSANDSDTESTPLVTSADLTLDKSGPTTVTAGQNVVYTITVTNDGISNAAAVSVADPTPTGLVFVSNTGDCTTAFPCSLGSLAPGAVRTITSTFSVPASYTTPDPISNTATVSSTTSDPVPANNSDTTSTDVELSADLEITKSGPADVTAGEDVVYTVTVTNNGLSDAAAVSVTDPTPTGLVFVSNTGDCTTAYPCSLGTVPAGATRTITSTFSVPASYTSPDPIVNTATVSTTTTDPVSANDSDTASTTLLTSADLSVTKTGPASVVSGTDLVYTIVVTNDGISDAQAVQVADATPSGLTFVSNSGDCTTPFPCVLGTMAPGEVRTFSATFAVPPSYTTPSPIVNTATVSSTTSDPNAADNTDTESTPVTQSADVSITKLGPNAVLQGSNLVYTVVVTNNGDSNAQNVSVADPTPPGLTFVSNSGDCTTAYPCSLGAVAPLEQRTITTTYFVPFSYTTPDPIVNTATVSTTTSDPDAANNSSSKSTAITVVNANLAVVKTGPAAAVPGSNLVYTIVVTNNGPDPATNAVLTDVLPPGLTFVSNTGDCSTAFPCSLGNLPNGATRAITTTLAVPASYTTPDPIENTAFITSDAGDSNGSDNTSVVQTPVTPQADLSLTKAGPATVNSGENVTYTIVVTNGGASDASGVSVADPTPAGLSFVSNTGDCTTAFPCSLGFVPAGETRTITATFAVPASYTPSGPIVNTATVSATTTDPDGSDNSDSTSTTVTTSADLVLDKSAPASVTPGTSLVFTVTLTNDGPSDAQAVQVADPTPTGLTFVSNTGDCTTAYPCALGTVAAGATRTITSTYAVPSGYLAPDPIVNTATATSTTSDPASGNNSDTTSTAVSASADVSITKTGPANAVPGEDVVYTIVVTNGGSSDAAGVTVGDATPSGLTFVSNAGDCTTAFPCALGTVAAGSTRTITATYSVPSSYTTPDPIVNTATVSTSTNDPVPGNDSDTESTPVAASADLRIDKTGPATVIAGNQIVYTITVTNDGSSDAQAVSVADPTPAGLTFVSNTGDCTTAFPCALGTLTDGQSRTITSTFTVPAGYAVPGPIVNTATVSSTTTDPNGANDSDSTSTTVTASADVSVTKTDATDPLEFDSNQVYTITVSNAGPSNATGVVVADTIDSATTFVSSTGGCTNAAGTLTCSVGALAAGQATSFTVTVHVPDTVPTGGTLQAGPCNGSEDICNNVSVTAAQGDPDPSDNADSEPTDVEPLNIEGLRLAITDSPDSVLAGTPLAYVLTYSNVGVQTISNAVLTVTYDASTAFVSADPSPTSGNATWALGSLSPGETGQVTVTVVVSGGATDGASLLLSAELNGTHAIPALADEPTKVRTDAPDHAALSVVKSVSPSSTYSGGLLIYTITVSNSGPATAYNTALSDTLPAEVTYLNAEPAPDSAVGNALDWNVGDLASGDSFTVSVYAETDDSLPDGTLIENVAAVVATSGAGTVASAGLEAEGSVVASVTGAAPDCGVVARLRSMGVAQPDGEFVYRLLWNDACENMPGVVLTQELPPGLTVVSVSSGDIVSYSVEDAGTHQRVVLDVGEVQRGRVGAAFVRTHIDASIAPQTDITSTMSLDDAAGRSFGATDTSTVRSQTAIQETRSYLRVTGPPRVIADKFPRYVVRYRDVPPNTTMLVTIVGGYTPISSTPDPSAVGTPQPDGSTTWTFTGLEGRGIIRFKGVAHFQGIPEGSNVVAIDATAISGVDGKPIVKSGRDVGVLGRNQVTSVPTAQKGKAVLKTQHFARGGKTAAVRMRYRKIVGSPIATLNVPSFLEPMFFDPGTPASSDNNAFLWDDLPEGKGVLKVKMTIAADLHEQESLAVGATVTDDFGTIVLERAKGAP